jgi:hypothetical protein
MSTDTLESWAKTKSTGLAKTRTTNKRRRIARQARAPLSIRCLVSPTIGLFTVALASSSNAATALSRDSLGSVYVFSQHRDESGRSVTAGHSGWRFLGCAKNTFTVLIAVVAVDPLDVVDEGMISGRSSALRGPVP